MTFASSKHTKHLEMKNLYAHLPATNIESLLALSARVIECLCQHSGFAYASPVFAGRSTELSERFTEISGGFTESSGCSTKTSGRFTETSGRSTKFAERFTEIAGCSTEFLRWFTESSGTSTEFPERTTNVSGAFVFTSRSYVHKIYNTLKMFTVYADSSPPALYNLFL